jgi:uncharacterized protein YjhX (UPF0386 family)
MANELTVDKLNNAIEILGKIIQSDVMTHSAELILAQGIKYLEDKKKQIEYVPPCIVRHGFTYHLLCTEVGRKVRTDEIIQKVLFVSEHARLLTIFENGYVYYRMSLV